MKNILLFTILSSYLFSVGGIITFNDGTTIEGEIQSVTQSAVNIIPMGLTFAEDIRLENIDSLKLSDGNIIIENSTVIYLYQNGEFLDPTELENDITSEDDYEGSFDSRRVLIWTLTFTAKTNIFPQVRKSGLIRETMVRNIIISDKDGVGDKVVSAVETFPVTCLTL